MEVFALDWLNLLVRWLHLVAGIAWVGSSFYFVWLDNHLKTPQELADINKGVGGEVWSVHGGGFYHAQKYTAAPEQFPALLHWFKWEAYTTWLSGMFLLVLVYWYGAGLYLIDPAVKDISQPFAILAAAGFIVGGWLIYDLLCRSPLAANDTVLSGAVLLLAGVLAWALCTTFSGRGAYIHFGAVLGTIMVANVFFVIIPGQKKMVAAAERGQVPDPLPGIKGKQRSVHNTYFTLPVLFSMTSSHFPVTYGNEFSWVILLGITLAGALIRIYFVARHKGAASLVPLVIAGLILIAMVIFTAPKQRATVDLSVTQFSEIRDIVQQRCTNCHSATPTHPAFPVAPAGVILDSDEQIQAEASRIYQQVVVSRVMPLGNLTQMSEGERSSFENWYLSSAEKQQDDR